jgi:PIN domain nuclease of toxin-antitoxin system
LLPVNGEHARLSAHLPDHHRDPLDRILVAQTYLEGATLVTADRTLGRYGVATLRADG